jgi:hypothetical protein
MILLRAAQGATGAQCGPADPDTERYVRVCPRLAATKSRSPHGRRGPLACGNAGTQIHALCTRISAVFAVHGPDS